jgi:hypothetical protein
LAAIKGEKQKTEAEEKKKNQEKEEKK